MNVKYESLERVTVKVSNTNDEARKYDISAEAAIVGSRVENISNGQVKRDDQNVATFNRWSMNSINYSMNGLDKAERDEVQSKIDAFIESVEAFVVSNPVTL